MHTKTVAPSDLGAGGLPAGLLAVHVVGQMGLVAHTIFRGNIFNLLFNSYTMNCARMSSVPRAPSPRGMLDAKWEGKLSMPLAAGLRGHTHERQG